MSIQSKMRAVLALVGLIGMLLGSPLGLGGCATGEHAPTGDPLTDIRNSTLSLPSRIESAEQAQIAVASGAADGVETRRVLKDVAWTRLAPTELRLAVLEAIFSDEAMEADSRSLASFLLPLEKDEAVVAYIGGVAVEREWVDVTPALVRCFARRESALADDQRSEAVALRALHPGQSLPEIVLSVFLSPGVESETYGVDWNQLTRADAWDLLGKLDADGSLRAGLLISDSYESLTGPSAKLRDDLRACYTDLNTIPLNAAELTWLTRLREPRHRENEAWWKESAAGVMDAKTGAGVRAGMPGDNLLGLRLRHIESIRWAAANHPQWLRASRGELFAELESRLNGRKFHRRSDRRRESDPLLQERLGQGPIELKWADVLAVLVIDEALLRDDVRASLFEQADMDFADETTEYGGTLSAGSSESETTMIARLFAPRPASRMGDERFVASVDMLRSSDRALAHYHFHVQKWGNGRFAGPSTDDRVYAWRQGRACLVFTGIRKGVLAVDYYQPNGLILDLGEITRP